ncbi:MAG: hypothetical protein MJZ93_02335 [Paludibacteraceae bacterium]|nr:hypothetical protein [Paludibacteraceae bacterium]
MKNSKRIIDENVKNLPPEMPNELPSLVSLLLQEVPDVTHAAVANAVFPALAAHLCNVEIQEADRRFKSPILLCALIARQSSGKDSVNIPINRIMADIDAEDKVNREMEQAYHDACKCCKSRKEMPEMPDGLVIRHLQANMTNAAFVKRLRLADGATTYTSMDELDTLKQLQGAGVDPMKICCLAFDAANYGQERVSNNSESTVVKIKWCWNASSTIARGRRFFANGVLDGTVSRINFCTIPKQRCQLKPRYEFKEVDEQAYTAELQRYIDNLNNANGRYSCQEALEMAERMADKYNDLMVLTENDIYDTYVPRAISIAVRKAMILYIADGCKWSKSIEEFAEWSLEYDLWCKNEFFGEALKKEEDAEETTCSGRSDNMLKYLDSQFTREDVATMRQRNGLSASGLNSMISNWTIRGYIVKVKKGMFCKTNKGAA